MLCYPAITASQATIKDCQVNSAAENIQRTTIGYLHSSSQHNGEIKFTHTMPPSYHICMHERTPNKTVIRWVQ